MVIAAEVNAFTFIGGALALWAVVLFALGVRSHDFPPKGAEKIIIAISGLLVVAAIVSAIVTSGEEKPKGEEITSAENKAGKEGSEAPDQGGTQAPEADRDTGQAPSEDQGQKPPAAGTVQTVRLNADPGGQLRFNKGSVNAQPGEVRLVMTNPSSLQHNVSLEGPGGLDEDGKVVSKGGASQVSAKLKPGKYTFYCSVPGHRQAGMEGTLTVTK